MKTCALVIGHKKNSPGAVNAVEGVSEFVFNEALAKRIESRVSGVDVQRVYRRTYSTLPNDINEFRPDFIISLHCNAFNRSATGTEVLYYHRSKTGKAIAEILQSKLISALGLADRGIKAKSTEDRGGFLLKQTDAPCLIAEPFFIDNNEDLSCAQRNIDSLVDAYVTAIEEIAGRYV